MNNTAKMATLETLLGSIPSIRCLEGCSDCCGPVDMSALEWRRIIQRTGRTNLKAEMMKATMKALDGNPVDCPLLDTASNKCSVYDIRPTICRAFGASLAKTPHGSMICPHGVTAEHPMSKERTDFLLHKATELGGRSPQLVKLFR